MVFAEADSVVSDATSEGNEGGWVLSVLPVIPWAVLWGPSGCGEFGKDSAFGNDLVCGTAGDLRNGVSRVYEVPPCELWRRRV